jgi:DNA-binding CsgD family transcriptional regulator
MAVAQQALLLLRLGRSAEAETAADTALSILEGTDQRYAGSTAAVWSARVLIERAALDRGEAVLRAMAPVEGHAEHLRLAAEGDLAAARGDIARAAELQLRVGELSRPLTGRNPAVDEWGHDAAMLLAAVGRRDEARVIVAECLAQARTFGSRPVIGWLRRAEGVVERDPDILRDAVELLADSEYRLDHAKALIDLGAVLRRAGMDRDARATLGEGLALARGYGALLLADRAREELRAAGGRAVDRDRRGSGALTPAEARVARLAAEGVANKEIAERLFVTIRTVETHLNSAYRKLGITSRRELAAALGDA